MIWCYTQNHCANSGTAPCETWRQCQACTESLREKVEQLHVWCDVSARPAQNHCKRQWNSSMWDVTSVPGLQIVSRCCWKASRCEGRRCQVSLSGDCSGSELSTYAHRREKTAWTYSCSWSVSAYCLPSPTPNSCRYASFSGTQLTPPSRQHIEPGNIVKAMNQDVLVQCVSYWELQV